jgi:hypothetical protein
MRLKKKTTLNYKNAKLIHVFRIMKSQPPRTWIQADFPFCAKGYLETLIALGLVEKVDVLYDKGGKLKGWYRGVRGYRLINKELEQTKLTEELINVQS